MLTLCLSASAPSPRLFLIDEDRVLAAMSSGPAGDPAHGPTWAEQTRNAVDGANASIRDIGRLAVDIGPGRLSAVRASVSFANGFAFGLGLPLFGVCSSLALGQQAEADTGMPALVVHKAAGKTGYAGFVCDGGLASLKHGILADVVANAVAGVDRAAVVGLSADQASALAPTCAFVAAGGDTLTANAFLRQVATAGDDGFSTNPLQPITEQSEAVR